MNRIPSIVEAKSHPPTTSRQGPAQRAKPASRRPEFQAPGAVRPTEAREEEQAPKAPPAPKSRTLTMAVKLPSPQPTHRRCAREFPDRGHVKSGTSTLFSSPTRRPQACLEAMTGLAAHEFYPWRQRSRAYAHFRTAGIDLPRGAKGESRLWQKHHPCGERPRAKDAQ